MEKFIGLHSLPGFTREMMARARSQAPANISIVRVLAENETGRVICEVEAPDRDTFVAWLGQINMPYDEICRVSMEMNTEGSASAPRSPGALARIKGLLPGRAHSG